MKECTTVEEVTAPAAGHTSLYVAWAVLTLTANFAIIPLTLRYGQDSRPCNESRESCDVQNLCGIIAHKVFKFPCSLQLVDAVQHVLKADMPSYCPNV